MSSLGLYASLDRPSTLLILHIYPSTVIGYHLPAVSRVRLQVYDLLGREVATLVDGLEEPGPKSVRFDATHLAGGVYFYRLQASALSRQGSDYVKTRKLTLVK